MSKLLQVIYASAAYQKMNSDELAEILSVAREKNTEKGISGMLAYHGGSFLQVLEGPEPEVEALLKTIADDPRHRHIKLLLKASIEEKEFEDWSMGFVDTTGLAQNQDGFKNYETDFKLAIREKTAARKILNMFKDGSWRRYVEQK